MTSAGNTYQLLIEQRPKLLNSPEVSLYCKFSRFMLEHPLSVEEIVNDLHWVDDAKTLQYWDLLYPSADIPQGLKVLLDTLGVNADAYLSLTGQDLLGRHFPPLSDNGLCKALRFCPDCLDFGFHSPIFQHWALDRCPLHGVRLLDRCPHCRNPIRGNAFFAIRDPLACPRCAELLSRDWDNYHSRERLYDMRIVSMMIRDRKRDIIWCQQPGVYVSRPTGLPKSRPNDLSSVALAVQAQRHLIWVQVPVGRWRSFHEMEGKSNDQVKKSFKVAIKEIESSIRSEFRHIRILIGGLDAEIKVLFSKVGRTPTGARLVGYASAVSVAYCRMSYAYGLFVDPCSEDSVDLGPMLSIHSRAVLNYGQFLGWEKLFQQTILADMRAMFALLLIESAKWRYLEDIAWNADLSPKRYQTAWCMHFNGTTSILRFRPRISVELLERLIRRYKNRILAAKHP